MSPADLDLFLRWATGLAGLIALLNLLRVKKRGVRAVLMTSAALVLAVAMQLYRANVAAPILAVVGVIIFCILVADVAMKSAASHKTPGGSK